MNNGEVTDSNRRTATRRTELTVSRLSNVNEVAVLRYDEERQKVQPHTRVQA